MSKVHGRGRLTDADHARIHELAAAGQKATAIAQDIKRHPATVHWYMYTQGLTDPTYNPNRPKSYVRNGRTVRLFTQEEDAFVEALRVQDYTLQQIADLTSKRFGTQRNLHAIKIRLIMLAARGVA